MNSIKDCVKLVKEADDGKRLSAVRYQRSRAGFLAVFKEMRKLGEVPSPMHLQCLYISLRWVDKCRNRRKKQLFRIHFWHRIAERYLVPLFGPDNPGIVGGGKGSIENDVANPRARKRLWNLLMSVAAASSAKKADDLIRIYARRPLRGLGVGTLSPIFWGLKSKYYPIVNKASMGGMNRVVKGFNPPTTLKEYINETVPLMRKFAKKNDLDFAELDRLCLAARRLNCGFDGSIMVEQEVVNSVVPPVATQRE